MKPVKKDGKVCAECPYRKEALPGYFGGNPIETYAEPILHDFNLACHLTQDMRNETICAGLVATRCNQVKYARPDHPELAESEQNMKHNREEREKCFSGYREFIKHHQKPL